MRYFAARAQSHLGSSGPVHSQEQPVPATRRSFVRSPQSLEVRDRVSKLQQRLGNIDVREYLSGDYLILYGVDSGPGTRGQLITVYLLAIRHCRQLSFDFEGFWQANRGKPV